MTRAVIKLTGDISRAMPIMERAIEGCAYNDKEPVAAFRYKNARVIMHAREIEVKDIENKNQAIEVINFLKGIINNANERTRKLK